ncbi:MAG: hypothetical protein JWP97_1949 [Labilithrix sp.]|nr:hypothetical protein [Labilithrix sp.]
MLARASLTAAPLALLVALTLVGGPAGCRLDWDLEPAPADTGTAAADAGGIADAAEEPVERDAGEGGAPLSCVGALLCTTFDDGLVSPPFDQTFTSPGGSLRVTPAGAAPHDGMLSVAVPVKASAPSNSYAQSALFTQKLTSAALAFDVLPVHIASGARTCIAGINFNDGAAGERIVRLLVGPGGTELQDRGGANYDVGATLPGRWSRVTLAVTVDGHVTVTFDGVTIIDVTLPAIGTSSATRAFLGINFVAPVTNAYEFGFDNVRLDGS